MIPGSPVRGVGCVAHDTDAEPWSNEPRAWRVANGVDARRDQYLPTCSEPS